MKALAFLLLLSSVLAGCGYGNPPNREFIGGGSPEGQVLRVVDTLPKRPWYEGDDVPFVNPTIPPYFKTCPGAETWNEKKKCSDAALISYINENIRYPEIAKELGIEGTIVVRFVVEKNGTLSNFEILRDPGGGCGEEALRVIKQMPAWEVPGMQGGVSIREQFTLPVRFKL